MMLRRVMDVLVALDCSLSLSFCVCLITNTKYRVDVVEAARLISIFVIWYLFDHKIQRGEIWQSSGCGGGAQADG